MPASPQSFSSATIMVSLLLALSDAMAITCWRRWSSTVTSILGETYPSSETIYVKGLPHSLREVFAAVLADKLPKINENLFCDTRDVSVRTSGIHQGTSALTELPLRVHIMHNDGQECVSVCRRPRIERETNHALDLLNVLE